MHAVIDMTRSARGRLCMVRWHGLSGRPRHLTDRGMHRDMRRNVRGRMYGGPGDGMRGSPCGRLCRGSSQQALGVGIGVYYRNGAGVRHRRGHCAYRQNSTRSTPGT